jgi:iron complex outermembrane recepter protein
MTRRKAFLNLFAVITLSATARLTPALAETFQDDEFLEKVASLDIEDLLNQEITSVGKKRQTLSQAAAAIYVLTNEDIRRSGVRSIPEALRLVPGLEVARVDAHQWAVTSRGFNGIFANKLLVLLDGRSLYSPLFSGVFWDVQDTFIEDIDRIEVIRPARLSGAPMPSTVS